MQYISVPVCAFALAACLSTCSNLSAATYSFAGYNWDQDNTPDTLGLLGNGATLGGAAFSNGGPTSITRSVGFVAISGNANAGFVGEAGFDPSLSLGRLGSAQQGLTQSDGTDSVFSSAVNLPAGNNGSTTRHGLALSWSGGRSLPNGPGADFVLYESGSNSTSPEGQMVRARLQSDGSYTPWFYQAVDAFQVYTVTPGSTVEGAFATAFDLSLLGVADGVLIDRIEIANMHSSDRINVLGTFASSGQVVFNYPGVALAQASVGSLPGMNPNSTFGSSALDPDPLYLAVLHNVVPEPAKIGRAHV